MADIKLAPYCVYTIRHTSKFESQAAIQEHIEAKWWAEAQRLFMEAQGSGERMAVLFGDATDCKYLVGWGHVESIARHDTGTRLTFSQWQPIEGAVTQELVLLSTGAPIAEGFIRPYALCKTPWFLTYERRRSSFDRPPRGWVVKGNPARNDLDDMLIPGEREGWITKKPPSKWQSGDFIFFWKSAPSTEIAGLGRIAAARGELDEEGNTRFDVEYLSGPLAHRPHMEELRRNTIVGGCSFLKAGPAGTVFPLTIEQHEELARIVAAKNPFCRSVLEDHLLGPGVWFTNENETEAAYDVPESLALQGFEGRRLLRSHYARERHSGLRQSALDRHSSKHKGWLPCEVCNFDFVERYGELGLRFAEVHHTVPLRDYAENGRTTYVEDLAVVCSNCHRMLHRRDPWLTVDELRAQVRASVGDTTL